MCWLSHTDVLNFYCLLVFNHSFFRNLKKALETLITWSIMKISEVDNSLILIDIIHGHAISRKKEDTSDILSQQSDHAFPRHISLQSKMSRFWKN